MPQSGYVYILGNPSIDGVVKIGKTQRDPMDRAKELSAATGVPTPFFVVYQILFEDCDKAEIFVHTRLEQFRIANNREFFKVTTSVAIDALLDAKKHFSQFANKIDLAETTRHENEPAFFDSNFPDSGPQNLGQVFFYIGNAHFSGLGNTIQDYDEALNYYQKSAKLGNADAFLQIGWMYAMGVGLNQDSKRALEYFKEAVQHGKDEAWAEMANLYHSAEHYENEDKCWQKYFSSEKFLQYDSSDKYMVVYNYINSMLERSKPIEYKKQISHIKIEVLEGLKAWGKRAKEKE